jgi:TPP-dependent indolepyruvate ferredoxin oxidoreductase alpha subunit
MPKTNTAPEETTEAPKAVTEILTGAALISATVAGILVINSDLKSVESANNELTNHTNSLIMVIMMLDCSDKATYGEVMEACTKIAKKQLQSRFINLVANVDNVRELQAYMEQHEIKENVFNNQNVFNVVSALAKVEKSDSITTEQLAERFSKAYKNKVDAETLKGESGDTNRAIITSGDLNKINQELNKIDEAPSVTLEDISALADKLNRVGELEAEEIAKLLADSTIVKLVIDINNKLKGYKLNGAEAEEQKAA